MSEHYYILAHYHVYNYFCSFLHSLPLQLRFSRAGSNRRWNGWRDIRSLSWSPRNNVLDRTISSLKYLSHYYYNHTTMSLSVKLSIVAVLILNSTMAAEIATKYLISLI